MEYLSDSMRSINRALKNDHSINLSFTFTDKEQNKVINTALRQYNKNIISLDEAAQMISDCINPPVITVSHTIRSIMYHTLELLSDQLEQLDQEFDNMLVDWSGTVTDEDRAHKHEAMQTVHRHMQTFTKHVYTTPDHVLDRNKQDMIEKVSFVTDNILKY